MQHNSPLSGYMWNQIRNAPFSGMSRDGKLEIISGGFQSQYQVESQVVGMLCKFRWRTLYFRCVLTRRLRLHRRDVRGTLHRPHKACAGRARQTFPAHGHICEHFLASLLLQRAHARVSAEEWRLPISASSLALKTSQLNKLV